MKGLLSKKPLNEQQVLKKLDIDDFRHLTKDKVIEMFSMIPEMDPEVAKAAISKFPEFASTMRQIIKECKETVKSGLKSNDASIKEYYETTKIVLNSLDKLLKDKNLSTEDKMMIVEKMQDILKNLDEKDTENKRFTECLTGMFCFVGAFAIGAAASLLGGSFKFPNNKA